jgi:hypothetical protein
MKACTTSLAVAVSARAMKCTIFEKRSTTTMICVWPSDLGKATMKSTEVDSQGKYDSSRGCTNLNFVCQGDLIDMSHKSEHTR